MTKYLIFFPGSAMDVSCEDKAAVGEAAVQWAGKIVKACRCSQELREFGYEPEG